MNDIIIPTKVPNELCSKVGTYKNYISPNEYPLNKISEILEFRIFIIYSEDTNVYYDSFNNYDEACNFGKQYNKNYVRRIIL